MKFVTYGLGGYDPNKPNGNIVEEYDDGIEAEPEEETES